MRRLHIIVLICLLFASGWSPVLAAAFCTRGEGHECCAAESAEAGHNHAAHQGMEMGGGDALRPAHAEDEHAGTSATALDHPVKDCAHCLAHSGVPHAPAATFGAAGGDGRDAATTPPQLRSHLFRASPWPSLLVSSRPHAPPTCASARHVLLSVFLI